MWARFKMETSSLATRPPPYIFLLTSGLCGRWERSCLPELLPRSQLVEVLLQTDSDHFQILSKSVNFPRNGISPEVYLVHQGSLGYLTT